MKKAFFTLVMIAVTFTAFSQKDKHRDKIEALKVAYVTEQLNLTKEEAQKFWPIYNAHETEEDMLYLSEKERRAKINDSMSEAEAKDILQNMIAFEDERHKLKIDFIKSLTTVLPAKKIVLLKKAEKDFRRKMFEEFKKRRESKKNKP